MDCRSTIRDVRRIDERPASGTDIPSSVLVGITAKPALPTLESSLIGSVAFRGMSALKALAGRIARIDNDDRHAFPFGFVFDKVSQLRKSPRMENAPHVSPNRGPRANVLKILQYDSPVRVFRERDDLLADSMIRVFAEASLLARKLLQPTFTRFRSFLLQPFSQPFVAMPHAFDVSARVTPSVRICQDVDDAEITAQKIFHLFRVGIVYVAGCRQVKRLLMRNQVGFALLRAKQFLLLLPADKVNLQASAGRPDGNQILFDVPSEQAQIIGNRAVQPKHPFDFRIERIGLRNLGDAAHNALRIQLRKPRSCCLIHQLVKLELRKDLRLPRLFRQPITAAIRFPQGVIERSKRTFASFELYFYSKPQKDIISRMELKHKDNGIPPRRLAPGCPA